MITNLPDARLTLQFHNRPADNITVDAITHASQSNSAVTYSERLNSDLNDAADRCQTINLEEKLAEYTKCFSVAPDAVKAKMLQEINRELDMLAREERYIADVQDPPEMINRRRTYGKGGPRRLTAAEIVEKEMKRNDKQGASQRSPITIVDLTSPSNTPRRPSQQPSTSIVPATPFIMTFSQSGKVIRSSNRPTMDVSSSQQNTDPEIIIVDSWTTEDAQATPNIHSNVSTSNQIRHTNNQISTSSSNVELPPQISPLRPKHQCKRKSIYQGELIQPRKHIYRRN